MLIYTTTNILKKKGDKEHTNFEAFCSDVYSVTLPIPLYITSTACALILLVIIYNLVFH